MGFKHRYEPLNLSYVTGSCRSKPAHRVRIGRQDLLAGGIQMVVEPIKHLIRNLFLLGSKPAVIPEIANSMENP
jgi:hypothetical protein